ncbi:MAG TPA: phage tail protein [Planctomycetota bacterium]|nr:phage tail protein [Planctomycetota bacterium]
MSWLGLSWTTVLTIAGAVIGGLFGAPWLGAVIGGLVGTVVDGQPDVEYPKIDDIQVQGFTDGDPMQRFIGRECSITSEVIWRGKLQAFEPSVEKSGHPVEYVIPVAFAFGRSFPGTPIEKISFLFANGIPIYWDLDAVDVTGTDIAATLVEVSDFDAGTGTTTVVQRYLDLTSSTTDLSGFIAYGVVEGAVGGDSVGPTIDGVPMPVLNALGTVAGGVGYATVSGFAGGGVANNGSWTVVYAATNTLRLKHPTNKTYTFATDAAGDTVSIVQAASRYVAKMSTKAALGMQIHTGLAEPDQDPNIVAAEGAGNVPTWGGLVYVTYSGFGLNGFGVSIPRVEAIIKERRSTDLPTAMKDIVLAMSDLGTCDVNTDEAVGVFRGYSVRGSRSLRDTLAPLLIAYNLVTQERDGIFWIRHRLSVQEDTIDEAELGAQQGDSETIESPLGIQRADPKSQPAQVTLKFLDPNRRLQTGTQVARRPALPLDNVAEFSLPITLDRGQGLNIARRLLYAEAIAATRIGTTLPPSRLLTYESMRFDIPYAGRDYTMLSSRVTRGANWLIELEGQADDRDLHSNESAVAGDPVNVPDLGGFGDPLLRVADIAPLENADAIVPALRFGVSRESPSLGWNGSDVYESANGGVTFALVDEVDEEATVGLTVSALATGSVGVWDLGSTLTFDRAGGPVPVTVTDDQVLNGEANWYLLGGEVVGVRTWTALGNDRYAGTRLLRGLMDTADRVGTHAANEPIVRVRPVSPLGRHEYLLSLVGQSRAYVAAPNGGGTTGLLAQSLTLNGSSLRPFSGDSVSVIGTRNAPGANDWTITWKERTRLPLWDTLGPVALDDAEDSEVYVVESYDATFTTLQFTITMTASGNGSVITVPSAASPSCVFDAADNGSAATIYLRIYQVGATSGLRSKKLQVTLTG